jgi:hypothetical protein
MCRPPLFVSPFATLRPIVVKLTVIAKEASTQGVDAPPRPAIRDSGAWRWPSGVKTG